MINIIYFRTDANDIIATGHVMRCLTVAKEFTQNNEEVSFIVSDKQSEKLIISEGYPVHVLDVDWKHLDGNIEAAILKKYIKKNDIIFIDTYSATECYIKEIKKLAKIIIFDDLFCEKYSADVIINYNLYYNLFDYEERYKNTKNQLLLGGKYVPLRKQFQLEKVERMQVDIENKKTINVLVICGGGDLYNTMFQIVSYIQKNDILLFKRFQWKIVCGAYNTHFNMINEFSSKYDNVTLYKNINNMAKVLMECDICISAASTVLYECCAMQLPTIFYCVADNQKYDADAFKDMMIYAGDFINNKNQVLIEILQSLKRIVHCNQEYYSMIKKLEMSVDINETENIVRSILHKEK